MTELSTMKKIGQCQIVVQPKLHAPIVNSLVQWPALISKPQQLCMNNFP